MKSLKIVAAVVFLALGLAHPAMAQIVSYTQSFDNDSDLTKTYTFSESLPLSDLTLTPSGVQAVFSGTLLDSNGTATVTATPTQTAFFTTISSGTVAIPEVTLSPGTLTSSPVTAPATFSLTTADFPDFLTGPSGTFTALTVDVSVVLSPGAYETVTGYVNLGDPSVPEPSSLALVALGAGALLLVAIRRRVRAA